MSAPDREVVRYVLAKAAPTEVASEVFRLLEELGNSPDMDAAGAIADFLEAVLPEREPSVLSSLAGTFPSRSFVKARLLAGWGALPDASAALGECLRSLPRASSALLALSARWRHRLGDAPGAVADLQRALHLFPDYLFYVRTEKLVKKLLSEGQWGPRRRVRVAILGSSTTTLLAPVLRSALLRGGIASEIYECPYGAFRQDILAADSGLYRFQPEHVLLLVNPYDLALKPDGGRAFADEAVAELRGLWRALHERLSCHVVQTSFGRPLGGAWGGLESILPEGRRRVFNAANGSLASDLPASVSLLDVEALPLAAGVGLLDEEAWHASKQYPSTAALPVFADAVAAHIRAVLGLTSKVLVLDLDNTMWGGIIGEDGVGGIRIGPPGAEGEAYQDLQRYAKELRDRGIVLAVCSKNNLQDAQEPFRSHDGMVLKLADFASFIVNWEDKATNLRAMTKELSLGMDSFVFLDDNPFERTLVREQCPEVVVPEVDASPWSMLSTLRRGMYFESVKLTREDLERNASYHASAAIRSIQAAGNSLEKFLGELGMVCESGPVDTAVLARVTQLVNKTNQFNLTTRRYNDEQVRLMSESADWWCHWFRLSDRFGDHGLVGLVFVKIEGVVWRIDTWLMSCRVLGRRMEDYMCRVLLDAAAAAGAMEVQGEYIPSSKNEMVSGLYPRMGFEPGDGTNTFVHHIGRSTRPQSPWIRSA